MPNRSRPSVVVIGGGVMGCGAAWRLARRGASVTVLERSVPGAEASSAAAGILGAQLEAHGAGPMIDLALASRALHPRWAEELERETGIDVGYRQTGVLKVALDARGVDRLVLDSAWQKRRRLKLSRVGARAAHGLEPELAPEVKGGVHFPEDGRIDPPRLLAALHAAAERAGARFRGGAYVRALLTRGGRARGVALEDGSRVEGDRVVVAAGSWTSLIAGLGVHAAAVRPARGQIVELLTPAPLLSGVVFGPRAYLVPRDDGRTLVGSTLEFVGYKKNVTARAVRDLLDAAIELCPALADATLGRTWSNFRPYTDDERPLLGPADLPNLVLASGHYRNGILLAPISAEIVEAAVFERPPPIDLEPFRPGRVTAPKAPARSGSSRPRRSRARPAR